MQTEKGENFRNMGYAKEFTQDEISSKVAGDREVRLVLNEWEEDGEEKSEFQILVDGIPVRTGTDLIGMCEAYKEMP